MFFDLFYELSVPAHLPRSDREVYTTALDEIQFGEQLGFNTAWLVEHHFMPEYSHSPAPETFLAALSQRTQTIRLGHAIVPLPYNHPVRVAERIAMLDVLSNGRIEFGFGRGFSPQEYAAFGLAMQDSRRYTLESYTIIRQALETGKFDYAGDFFELKDLPLRPHCIQRPHPPIWTAAVSPDSFELAAELGVGVLIGPFKPWFMIKEDIKRFKKAWVANPDNAGIEPRIGMTVGIYCDKNGKQAYRDAKPAFEWFYEKLLSQTKPVLEKLYGTYEYYQRVGKLSGIAEHAIHLRLLETLGMAIVGTPEHCAKRIRVMQKAGVTHMLCAFGAGLMETQQTRSSMQLFAEQVMPEFDSTVTAQTKPRETAFEAEVD
jgi:alkanesulfonate monooxygenase SsuD/methylene tetrahydromethanopterin reductase-like flavin-dependent oxidoreductase (luciferase family)